MKKFLVSALALSVIAPLAMANASANEKHEDRLTVPGYVVHGINNYNGKHVVDFSKVSPSIPYLNAFPPVNEIGVYQANSNVSGTISATTNRLFPVATTRSFFDYFNPTGELDPLTVNLPLAEVGVNYLSPSFTDLSQRIVPVPFNEAAKAPGIYRKNGIVINPTVGEWEQISGKLTVVPQRNGKSDVLITIRNAFPNSVYTLWDLGATKPLTNQESGYAIPLGGIPNILLTDENGCGFAEIKLAYDLTKKCQAGADYCSSYVSAFYAWDYQAYGASAAATWAKAPTGIYGANQMIWPLSGDVLIQPQTSFVPNRHGCK